MRNAIADTKKTVKELEAEEKTYYDETEGPMDETEERDLLEITGLLRQARWDLSMPSDRRIVFVTDMITGGGWKRKSSSESLQTDGING
jgi:hypothetical protein